MRRIGIVFLSLLALIALASCGGSSSSGGSNGGGGGGTTQTIDLAVSVVHNGSGFTVGAPGVYTVTITNVGNTATTGAITYTDTLPTGLSFTSGTGTNWTCSAVAQAVTCTNPGPIAGSNAASVITLTVGVAAGAEPSVSNTGTVATSGDTNAANNSSTDQANVSAAASVDLALQIVHVGSGFTGGTPGVYTVTITNAGTAATTGAITVTDTLPSGLTFSSGTGQGWSCSANGQAVTCTNPGPIAASAQSVITLTVAVSVDSVSVMDSATVTTAGDNNAANNTGSDTASVAYIDLSMGDAPAGTFTQGQAAAYTLTVTNIGNEASVGAISVTDNLPAGLTYTSATGNGWSCGAVAQVITCTNSGSIAATNGSGVITLNVSVAVNASSSVTNNASVQIANDANAANNSASANTNITQVLACPTGAESALAAPYAFYITGFDANGPVAYAGSFTPNSTGGITAGVMDINRTSASGGAQPNLSLVTAGSSYTLGIDNTTSTYRGCLTLQTSAGTIIFRYSLGDTQNGVLTRGSIIEFDDATGSGARGSGIIRSQKTSDFGSTVFANNWVFELAGSDATSQHFAVAGYTAETPGASGGTIDILAADSDDGGTLGTNMSGSTGTYTATNASTGRGTGKLIASPLNMNFAFYVANNELGGNEIIAISIDPIANNPISAGEFLEANAPNQPNFGNYYILEEQGYSTALLNGSPIGDVAELGTLDFSPIASPPAGVTGNLSGTLYVDIPSTSPLFHTSISAQYLVNTVTGRVTISNCTGCGGPTPIIYPTNLADGRALIVGADTPATSGVIASQGSSAPSLSNSSLNSSMTFAAATNPDNQVTDEVGQVKFNGAGVFNGIADLSGPTGTGLSANQAISAFTYAANSDGSGTFNGNASTIFVTNGLTLFFLNASSGVTSPQVLYFGF